MALMNLFAGQQWRIRQRKDLWKRGGGEEGEGEMCGESDMDTYFTICKIESR